MKNWVKILLVIALLGAVIGAGVAFMVYNKPHQQVIDAKPTFDYTANALVAELAKDTAAFKQKITDKVIRLRGRCAW